jgi:hypothetical protein
LGADIGVVLTQSTIRPPPAFLKDENFFWFRRIGLTFCVKYMLPSYFYDPIFLTKSELIPEPMRHAVRKMGTENDGQINPLFASFAIRMNKFRRPRQDAAYQAEKARRQGASSPETELTRWAPASSITSMCFRLFRIDESSINRGMADIRWKQRLVFVEESVE